MESSTSAKCWPLVCLVVAQLLCVQIAAKPFYHFRSRQATSENVLAIRPLICLNKSTGESGVCMFTLDCMALNGTSLGVCGDKMFFGSCCVIPQSVLDEMTSNDLSASSTLPTTTAPITEASQAPTFTESPANIEPSTASSEAPSVSSEAPADVAESAEDSDETTDAPAEVPDTPEEPAEAPETPEEPAEEPTESTETPEEAPEASTEVPESPEASEAPEIPDAPLGAPAAPSAAPSQVPESSVNPTTPAGEFVSEAPVNDQNDEQSTAVPDSPSSESTTEVGQLQSEAPQANEVEDASTVTSVSEGPVAPSSTDDSPTSTDAITDAISEVILATAPTTNTV